jgi:hypothetical protein
VFAIGKLSAADVFDNNQYSHEPRTQFLNWSLMANGVWEFSADPHGYTTGLAIEYYCQGWATRFGTFVMSAEANGLPLDPRFSHAHGSVIEVEKKYELNRLPGKVRVMACQTRANMGSYTDTINTPSAQMDVTKTRTDRVKQGLGFNLVQQLNESIDSFFRAGWNDGKTEKFAFTEIDQTLSGGIFLRAFGYLMMCRLPSKP